MDIKFDKYYLCGYDRGEFRFIVGREINTGMLYKKDPHNVWVYTSLKWCDFNKKLVLMELRENEVGVVHANIWGGYGV